MAYSNETTSIIYIGDGVQTNFSIPFDYTEVASVMAELWDVSDPLNPIKLPFSNPTDWNVVGSNVVTSVAPTSDEKIMLFRDTKATHETHYSTYEFPFDSVNPDFDKVYQIAQENKEALSRAIINDQFYIANGGTPTTIGDVNDSVDGAVDYDSRITQNESDIGVLQPIVSNNSVLLGSHSTKITDNENNITTNVTNIGTNTSAITLLDGRVLALEGAPSAPPVLVILSAAGNYVASANDRIIVKSDGATIDLPAVPIANDVVLVKVRGTFSTVPVVSGNGKTVDGAASNTINSNESSLEFLYDGTEWVIV